MNSSDCMCCYEYNGDGPVLHRKCMIIIKKIYCKDKLKRENITLNWEEVNDGVAIAFYLRNMNKFSTVIFRRYKLDPFNETLVRVPISV